MFLDGPRAPQERVVSREVKTPEERLQFYAGQFPIVEVDSAYYGIPAEKVVGLWVERTPPAFLFNNCYADYGVRNARDMQAVVRALQLPLELEPG